jgi:hypothetical protein
VGLNIGWTDPQQPNQNEGHHCEKLHARVHDTPFHVRDSNGTASLPLVRKHGDKDYSRLSPGDQCNKKMLILRFFGGGLENAVRFGRQMTLSARVLAA